MEAETQRLLDLLKVSLKTLGVTNRDVARSMGLSPSYITKLFTGVSEIRLDHVIRICRAAGLEPAEFFSLAYPRRSTPGTPAAAKLREVLRSIDPPSTPAASPESPSEAQMQEMLKATLERMLGRSGGT